MSDMRSDAFKHSNFRSGPKRSPAAVTCIYFSHSYSVCVSLCLITRERKEAGRAWRWRLLDWASCSFHGVFGVSRRIDIHDLSQCSAGVRWLLTHYTLIHSSWRHSGRGWAFFSVPRPSNPPPILCRHTHVGDLSCWREENVSFSVVFVLFFLHLNFFLLFSSHSFSTAPRFLQQYHGLVSCTHLAVILFSSPSFPLYLHSWCSSLQSNGTERQSHTWRARYKVMLEWRSE